jgi:O-antigen ligase
MSEPQPRPGAAIERLVLVHAGIFLVGTTWLFGGNAGWVRPYLAAWGTLGIALTPFAAAADARRPGSARTLVVLWPFLLFNALVLVSCLTPGFHRVQGTGGDLLALTPVPSWRPSAAVPTAALAGLWLFDGIYLSSFNLLLAVRTRASLRGLAVLAVANAVVLSVFGTAQKLAGAQGPYFGLVRTPQKFFFSSFIYHNHWGSFAVLMAAACLGLVVRQARRMRGQTFFRSSAMAGLVAVLFIAATPPLSGSRSCSALMVVLLGGAFLGWIARVARKRTYLNESPAPPILLAVVAVVAALAGIWYISRDTIETRVAATEQQISDLRAEGSLGQRSRLYGDTWLMARDRLWFGWGMASYPYVFPIYNSQDYPNPVDNLQNNYHDAHNDWLQSVAEHGVAGTVAAGLLALVPLSLLRGRPRPSPLSSYLFAGCGLIAAYAWVEFPFGNVAVVLCWWLCFFIALGYARLDSPARQRGAQTQPPNP